MTTSEGVGFVPHIVTIWVRREGLALAATLALSGALSGCSVPIPGLIDYAPTGAIHPATYPFAQEDWDSARPALAAAIAAAPGAAPAPWANATSGQHGMVTGVGARYARAGANCRAFVSRIGEGEAAKAAQGEVCERDGDVKISDAAPFAGI